MADSEAAEQTSEEQVKAQPSLDQQDIDNLAEIETELAKQNLGSGDPAEAEEDFGPPSGQSSPDKGATPGAFVPSGALPQQNGKLSQFAGEFWFPEARNCTCCKGFKHGCGCCVGGVDTCRDPNCIDDAFKSQVSQELANRPPSNIPPAPPASYGPASGSGRSNSGAGGGAPNYCKFESSPGGCRYGSGCRFVHRNPPAQGGGMSLPSPQYGYAGGALGSAGSAGNMSPTSTSTTKCIYFARGHCQFGDNCRFLHAL